MPMKFPPVPPVPPAQRGRGVTAVLGPTNTGKTHLAIERMLAHSSGLIGLPLRLLAREVYNRAVERVGADAVALITGEEKIKPPNARFWVSTVEAMPQDLDVAFVAIDEIQLAADLERGHVFTGRILNRRGREETLVLGAATVRGLIERLLPGIDVVQRPRLSRLNFAGEKKITRLPRRSAIVAFSAEEVYAIAELIRRQRGGAAVVLGALSPRTRNAQVEIYQSGDVDYLVATDAIGMGLNLDVDHVAFASDRKFDGYQFRRLNPAEMAQIAGRAGRASRDGTFGTTGRCPAFDHELVERLESHNFEPVRVMQWRNAKLDFRSLTALLASLAESPREEGLTRAPLAEDVLVLERAAKEDAIVALAKTPDAVERLWEVCQIPDYRKIAPAAHADLVMTLYGFLMREGRIASDWMARQVAHTDRTDGDIDTLSNRIAQVRTWTFAANRPDWLDDPGHWQGVARGVEDRLSDALHERLTQRFVDRRTSVLMRRLRENAALETEITKTGDLVVEGHVIGHLSGFEFAAADSSSEPDAKALRAAAQKVLASEIEARAKRLGDSSNEQFVLAADGTIRWTGDPVARLIAGENALEPRFRILADEQLTGPARDSVEARLTLWLKSHIEKLLGPLVALGKAEGITGIARGVAFQLVEALGVLERQRVAEEVKGLDQTARAGLRAHGIRFGAHHIYMPLLLKPAPRALSLLLWGLKHGGLGQKGISELPALAASGRTSIPLDPEIAKPLYRVVGYRVCGSRALRVDILERLADLIRPALSWRPGMPGEKPAGSADGRGFTVTVAMTSLVGCAGEDFANILRAVGYRMERRPAPLPETKPEAVAAATPLPDETTAAIAAKESPQDIPVTAELPDAASTAAPTQSEPSVETVAEAPSKATLQPAEAVAAAAASAEPAMIEVWRPGRPRDERRPPRRQERERRAPQTPEPPAAADAAKASEPPAPEVKRERPHRHKSHKRERPERERHAGRTHRPDRDQRPPRERSRERPIDPNSPFAALLELKARLEAGQKNES
jgi:ATP-dependent RNA helicase SUPV3L1/SUV3